MKQHNVVKQVVALETGDKTMKQTNKHVNLYGICTSYQLCAFIYFFRPLIPYIQNANFENSPGKGSVSFVKDLI